MVQVVGMVPKANVGPGKIPAKATSRN